MSYTNADGLYVLTNGEAGVPLPQGTAVNNVRETLIIDLTLASLGSTFTSSSFTPQWPVIPANSIIVNADLVMTAAATSGGSATLTIGTYNAATGAAIDADGIDATIALTAIDAIGDVVQCDGAQVSGLVTVGTVPVVVGAIFGTAAFTAGAAKLVIEYIKL